MLILCLGGEERVGGGEGRGGEGRGGEGRGGEGRGGEGRREEEGKEKRRERRTEDKLIVPGALKSLYQHVSPTTHHCENGSWFLDPQCLHHLEHVHHSLSLAALDGGGNGTEHTRAANSITGQ